MVRHFDHVTIAVADVDAAIAFFALFGFDCDKRVLIEGEVFARYMDVPGIVAEHVTLVLRDAAPRLELQLLGYRQPVLPPDPMAGRLDRPGFNHICFDVADLDAELTRLSAAGVQRRSEVLRFHGRKLVFLRGPGEVVIELSERSAEVA
jgi:catechol 2,3-dioxygenase-like lactoylglutathione lyase family enzyme